MSRFRLKLITTVVGLLIVLLSVSAYGQPKLVDVPSNLADTQRDTLTKRRATLVEERNILTTRMDAQNKKRVPKNSPEERELHQEAAQLKSEMQKHEAASREFNQAVANAKRAMEPVMNPQIAELMRGIQTIQVPPPVLTDQVSVQLRPEDTKSERILLGTEFGVAAAEVAALRIAGQAFTVYPRLALATGRIFIAMEGGADVYLVKQGEVYEQALRWLKDEKKAPAFTAVVRALKENKPLPSGTSEELIRAAKAILDPKLGNNGMRIAWGAMWSPEAKAALVRRACIELGAELIGEGVKGYTQEFLAAREPAFKKALTTIESAEAALKKATDPAEQKALEEVIKEAGGVMGRTYRAIATGTGHVESIITKELAADVLKRNP